VKKLISKTLFRVGLLIAMALPGGAKTFEAIKGKSTLTYILRHPMHRIEGVNKNFSCTVELGDDTLRSAIRVKALVADFNSGNSSRDSHALEILEGLKYPSVEFASDSVRKEGPGYRIFGQLNFHGIQRALDFTVIPKLDSGWIHVLGTFTLKLSDFNVKRPSLLFVPTEDLLRIDIDAVAQNP